MLYYLLLIIGKKKRDEVQLWSVAHESFSTLICTFPNHNPSSKSKKIKLRSANKSVKKGCPKVLDSPFL